VTLLSAAALGPAVVEGSGVGIVMGSLFLSGR
jgi:hypothetical protein